MIFECWSNDNLWLIVAFLLADGKGTFPLVMVGGVLEANRRWDIGKEVINCISKHFPGVQSIRPQVSLMFLFILINALRKKRMVGEHIGKQVHKNRSYFLVAVCKRKVVIIVLLFSSKWWVKPKTYHKSWSSRKLRIMGRIYVRFRNSWQKNHPYIVW